MNKLDIDYQNLIKDILENGIEKKDRTGTGTLSVFGRQIRHKMSTGFPILTTKKMAFKTMVTELRWFLMGSTNIKYLVDNNCHIWDGDAYKSYRSKNNDLDLPETLYNNLIDDLGKNAMFPIDNPSRILSQEEFINKIKTDGAFAKEFGDLGPIYGFQWRNWGSEIPFGEATSSLDVGIDQISELIKQLKENPDSRRLLINAWNPSDLSNMILPPCHYSFQVYTRELTYDEKINEARKRFGFELEDGTRTFDINSEESIKFLTSTQRAISLMFNMRSTDVGLGLPFNLASYGLLLMMIADEVNMLPDELIYNGGDVHLYLNHIEPIKEQLNRIPYDLPTVIVRDGIHSNMDGDIILQNYKSHPKIYLPLSN